MIEESKKGTERKEDETEIQKSFIKLAGALTEQKTRALGRPLTYCLVTFGCQMN